MNATFSPFETDDTVFSPFDQAEEIDAEPLIVHEYFEAAVMDAARAAGKLTPMSMFHQVRLMAEGGTDDKAAAEEGWSTGTKVLVGLGVVGAIAAVAYGVSRSSDRSYRPNPALTVAAIRRHPDAPRFIRTIKSLLESDKSADQKRKRVGVLLDDAETTGISGFVRGGILQFPSEFGFSPALRDQFLAVEKEHRELVKQQVQAQMERMGR